MFRFIKQVIIVLLSFSEFLATKCMSLNNEPCMIRPTLIKFKVFNMIANRNESKTIVKPISWDFKFKFNSTTCNSNKKWNNESCQCECKNYCT